MTDAERLQNLAGWLRRDGLAVDAEAVEMALAENARLRAEVGSVRISWDAAQERFRKAEASLEKAIAERDEARDWVRKITAEREVLRCAFCGQDYPPGTPVANHDLLAAHIGECPKHPMRAVEAELAELKEHCEDISRVCFELASENATHDEPVRPMLCWTAETPTRPGWYWVRGGMYGSGGASMVGVRRNSDGHLRADGYALPDGVEWWGPILKPEGG